MRNKGFTLIELMIVVVIIGILAAIAIPNFMSMRIRAKEAAVQSNMHTMQLSVENFSTMAEGSYPSASGNMLNKTVSTVLGALGIVSNNPQKLATADAMTGTDTDTDCLLPGNNTYRNPFSPAAYSAQSEATVDDFPVDLPSFTENSGLVRVTPVYSGGSGHACNGYAIHGEGHRALLTLTLQSGQ